MLKAANTSVETALKMFNGAGVSVGLLAPTRTGLGKGIMDSTMSFRDFLRETDTHDYATQQQGVKTSIPAVFVFPDRCVDTTASLYRPKTKKGDPRIWFSRLPHYCKPTDLLAVVKHAGKLCVFNMSNPAIALAFAIPGSVPHEILAQCSEIISATASELLGKLRDIHRLGFVRGVSHGDTSVGMTLEHLLGIPPNSAKTPDYKGIELKASRQLGADAAGRAKGKGQITLFTNTPDWKRSPLNAEGILQHFGYPGEHGRLQLYCTVSNEINPQGLYLDAHNEIDLVNKARTESYTGDVAVWALDVLKARLAAKHHETFWVKATAKKEDGHECFRYDLVRHTRRPNTSNLASLFDGGVITLDYAMHLKPNGKVRDHGYLFRTTGDKFPLIFPIEKVYDLENFV